MLNLPFFQITLPLMVTFVATVWAAQWSQNKRIDDLGKRIDDLRQQFGQRLDDAIGRLDRESVDGSRPPHQHD